MFGRLGLGLAILALPGAAGASDLDVPPAAAAPAAAAGETCPAPEWGADADHIQLPAERVWNQVSLERRGAIRWNEARIDPPRLRQYMDLVATMNPIPETYLEVDPETPCDTVAGVVAAIGGAVDCTRLCTYAVRARRSERDLAR
jgi:hypothetical protein